MAVTPEVRDERPLADALDAIRNRRAIKEYLDTPIPKERIMDQENDAACWCAIENLLVAATARGLGSYPSTGDWIDLNFVGPVLGLTEKERPVACIFLGYSEQKTMAKRLPVERHTT